QASDHPRLGGGAIYAEGANVLIEGSVVRGNGGAGLSGPNGGGILARGALSMEPTSGSLTIRDTLIEEHNSRNRGSGGGIFTHRLRSVEITRTQLLSNAAGYPSGSGGGAYLKADSILISGTLFKGNSSSNGGGLYV